MYPEPEFELERGWRPAGHVKRLPGRWPGSPSRTAYPRSGWPAYGRNYGGNYGRAYGPAYGLAYGPVYWPASWIDSEPDEEPYEEMAMHHYQCRCNACREQAAGPFELLEFSAGPLSEAEEIALASELLEVSSEAELEQFLGNVFKSVWSGVKKVGSAIGKVAKPLGGVLKGIAKQALPFVGGALGSFIPIPGVGTALGRAAGSMLSQALEMELAAVPAGERDFEMARRFVRFAGAAAQAAADGDGSPAAVRRAVLQTLREQCAAGTSETYCGPWRKRRASRFATLEIG